MENSENVDEERSKKELQRGPSVLSRKESCRRKTFKVERLEIEDIFDPSEFDQSVIPKRHLLETLDYDQMGLQSVVTSELRDLGVILDIANGRQSRSKSRKPSATPQAILPDQFLVNESIETTLENGTSVRLCIPHVVKQTCEFIREQITTEGIFRKSGLSSRVQSLKHRFNEKDADVFNPDDTVFDASSVLKQYLRELPNPLIPYEVHPVFLKCLDHTDEKIRIESILLAIYLLPLSNIHILAYLMPFLFDVVKNSHLNRMGHKNLALVLTPNIMPIEEKKNGQKAKDSMLSEKLALEKNRKVVEIMILYGDHVGWVSSKLARALEVQLLYRNSDDELEVERGREGRRKKRRSGSLTRMFGFLRKVTNGKGGDTPCSTVDTPSDFGLHTPVMKASTKKRANDEPIFSTQKKKTILDAVRRNGLNGKDPNSPAGFLACPSPAICYDPSPMRTEWKNLNLQLSSAATPNIVRDKKRSKSTPENSKVQWSASSKSSSKPTKLGFGRKSGKKVASQSSDSGSGSELNFEFDDSALKTNPILNLPKYFKNFSLLPSKTLKSSVSATPKTGKGLKLEKNLKPLSYPLIPTCPDDALLHQQVNQNLQKTDKSASVVSIHSLQDSPRKKLSRQPSSPKLSLKGSRDSSGGSQEELLSCNNIPPPPEFSDEASAGGDDSAKIEVPKEIICADTSEQNDGEGEYVTLAPDATVNDLKNQAFISSSNSLDITEDSTSHDDISPREQSRVMTRTDDEKQMSVEMLRLTPLIREINNLTMFAQRSDISLVQDLTLPDTSIESPVPALEESSILEPPFHTLPRRSSTSLAEVAREFKRTLQEEKIIKLRIEMNKGLANTAVSRQNSVKETTAKGVSPSQRKINSFRRRKSHDSAKSTPLANSPRFMSLRSPRSRPVPPPLTRSPTRCTLRRGRPNTAWTGLPRPSPGRGNMSVCRASGRSPRTRTLPGSGATPREKAILRDKGNLPSPVMRRMSSVQELVHKLETKAKIHTSRSATEVVADKARRPTTLQLPSRDNRRSLPSNNNTSTWHAQDLKKLKQAAAVAALEIPVIAEKPKTPRRSPRVNPVRSKPSTPNQGNDWVCGDNFFSANVIDSPDPCQKADFGNRESIHFLKTRNAGKVSASVRMFDGMVKKTKSPGAGQGKSMIPRYTALHTIPSRTELTNNS